MANEIEKGCLRQRFYHGESLTVDDFFYKPAFLLTVLTFFNLKI